MAIYLDNQIRTYLERIFKDVPETDFIGRRVQDKLRADREEMESRQDCEHKFGEYVGEKTCCVKCGGLDVGMGENWRLK